MESENQHIEWKECWKDDFLKHICAFANSKGGKLLIGITNKGEIKGIKEETILSQLDILVRDMNNPQIISPTFYLSTELVELDGKTPTPEILLQAGDVFCLPTYRESFGMSVIEASCLGLPVICSNTYGVLDAMVDNVTGLRCKVQDVESLYQQMKQLSTDSKLRNKLGINGRERVLKKFSGKFITQEWVKLYNNLK